MLCCCLLPCVQRLPVEQLQQLYSQALDMGLQVLQEEVLEASAGSGADDNMAAIMEMVEPVKVSTARAVRG